MFKLYLLSLKKIKRGANAGPLEARARKKILRDLRNSCSHILNNFSGKKLSPEECFTPLFLACKTKRSNLMIQALDSIQKLIALEFVRKETLYHDELLLDVIVTNICGCFQKERFDEKVNVQILKALLHVTTNNSSCEVTGKALYQIVKTCFNVYLVTKDAANKTTAQGTLTQIFMHVFQRLPLKGAMSKRKSKKKAAESKSTREEVSSIVSDIFTSISIRFSGKRRKSITQDDIYQRDAIHLFKALCLIAQKKIIVPVDAKNDLESMSVLGVDDSDHTKKKKKKKTPYNESLIPVLKIELTLQILIEILVNCRKNFKVNKFFLRNIKQHLLKALFKNCVSSFNSIFSSTLNVLTVLIRYYHHAFRNEIGLFLRRLVLPLLESTNCGYQQKMLLLTHLRALTGKTHIRIFATFDCEKNEKNLHERFVDAISKVVTGESLTWYNEFEMNKVRNLAFQILANLMKGLNDWMITKKENSARETFFRKKMSKMQLEEGIRLFAIKPKKGIAHLISCGIIPEDTPKELAIFLRTERDLLDKQQMGNFLGDHHHEDVLSEYSKLFDFSKQDIVSAFRIFLGQFRLPKEEQQISRCIEHFARRFYSQNPQGYENADACFFLAYSIMVIQTDLHHPNLKSRERMKVEGYMGLTAGKNGEKDYDKELLTGVFNDIKSNKIEFKFDEDELDEAPSSTPGSGNNTPEVDEDASLKYMALVPRMRTLFDRECRGISRRLGSILLEKIDPERLSSCPAAENITIVRAMLMNTWRQYLSACSKVFENIGDNYEEIKTCMMVVSVCIRLCCFFQLDVARNTFISNLELFSEIANTRKFLQQKNIECIRLLLNVIYREYNYLRSSWSNLLRVVSKLEYLKRGEFDYDLPSSSSSMKRKRKESDSVPPGTPSKGTLQIQAVHKKNSENVFSQIEGNLTEKVFEHSGKLSNQSIVHFVNALVEVSATDLHTFSKPRTFLLHKIPLVAHYNGNLLDRPDEILRTVYTVLSDHLLAASLHKNQTVSMTGINHLKQLAVKLIENTKRCNKMKFLETFDFLNPFEQVVSMCRGGDIKVLVIDCLYTIGCKFFELLSAQSWIRIMNTIRLIAKDELDEKILEKTFKYLVHFFEKYFEYLDFNAFVYAVLAFAENKVTEEIRNKSLDLFVQSAAKVVKNEKEFETNWKTIVNSFKDLFISLKNRENCVSTFESIIESHSGIFQESTWESTFDMFFDVLANEDKNWVNDNFKSTYVSLIKMTRTYWKHSRFYFPKFIDQHFSKKIIGGDKLKITCVNEELFSFFVTKIEQKTIFDDKEWTLIIDEFYTKVIEKMEIAEIFSNPDTDPIAIQVKTSSHLCFLKNIVKICSLLYSDLGFETYKTVLENILKRSYNFTKEINESGQYSVSAAKHSRTNLLRIENNSIGGYFSCLIKMYQDTSSEAREKFSSGIIGGEFKKLIERYLLKTQILKNDTTKEEKHPQYKEQIEAIVPIVDFVLTSLIKFSDDKRKFCVGVVYKELCMLMLAPHVSIRRNLSRLFLTLQFV